jgi:type I restriction enzyme, S subunit
MASEWREAALGDVIELKRGFDLPQQDRAIGTFPIVSSSGVSDHHSVAKVKGPGVVTGRYGTIGEVFFVQEDFWPLNTTLYVCDFKGNDPRFVSYLLRTVNFLAYSDKAAVPGVNRNHLHSARVFVPTKVSEQQAIARVLGTLDDKIELNHRMNGTLEGMARALFNSWFVDFDPVRAKVEGRTCGLPEGIASLFPESFALSEEGEIPSGWQFKPIGELATVNGGSTPSTKEPSYWEGGTHFWATPKDLSALETPVLLDTERKITDSGLTQIASGLLPAGTVLMSSRAPIGYLAIAEIPVAINQGFIAMRAEKGVSNLFLLRWAEWAHDLIVSRANGSTFLEISKSSFRPILVAAPSDAVMKEFDRIARLLHSRIVSNERASRTLAKLRDALLPKLVSGELRIPDVERIIGEQV